MRVAVVIKDNVVINRIMIDENIDFEYPEPHDAIIYDEDLNIGDVVL
jgi:hypothetical protein